MNPTSELKPVLENWDKVVRLNQSLERYEQLLAGKERASDDIAFVMSTALENIDPEFDIKEGSAITLRAIKEAISAGANAAWKIIKQIWQFLNAMYIKFTGSIRRVRRNQENTTRRLGKLGSKTTLHSKMSVAGVQRLSVDGKFMGVEQSAIEDIKQVTNYCLNIYPKAVTQIARNCSRKFLNILEESAGQDRQQTAQAVVETFIEVFQANFRGPPGATAMKTGEMAGVDPKNHRRSDLLVGNTAFIYMSPEGMSATLRAGKTDPAEVVGSSFFMHFTELQMNVADKSEREIDIPSVKELTLLTEEISRVLTLAEKAESGRKDFDTVKTVVDDSIRQIMEKADTGETVPASNLVLQITGEISKKLAEPLDNFTHWLAITLNVWLTFINHCIDHYETEGV
jgi:hypothetical protein